MFLLDPSHRAKESFIGIILKTELNPFETYVPLASQQYSILFVHNSKLRGETWEMGWAFHEPENVHNIAQKDFMTVSSSGLSTAESSMYCRVQTNRGNLPSAAVNLSSAGSGPPPVLFGPVSYLNDSVNIEAYLEKHTHTPGSVDSQCNIWIQPQGQWAKWMMQILLRIDQLVPMNTWLKSFHVEHRIGQESVEFQKFHEYVSDTNTAMRVQQSHPTATATLTRFINNTGFSTAL